MSTARPIAVYCSSSNRIDRRYKVAAEEMGRLLAEAGHELVYGGGDVGLMGIIARAAHEHGGQVYGVIPYALREREGVAYELADELILTDTMQERKRLIFTRAEAFLVLPGGFGTLEEFMEVLTLRQLGYHDKPIALLNTGGFYDRLLAVFDHFYQERVAHEATRTLYRIADTPEEALRVLNAAR